MKLKVKLILAIILIAILVLIYINSFKTSYYKNNLIYYPENRPKLQFTRILIEDNENYSKEKITFESKNAKIYGYLFLPKKKEKVPGIIFLPAAQATKEGAQTESKVFLREGFAALTIDQRGVGETNGNITLSQDDFNNFKENKESFQSLMVYDTLRSFDLLSQIPQVDNKKIIMSGSSMGGRTAIIASALDKNIHGALIISSSGYDIPKQNDEKLNSFLYSINPNNYISLIQPRKIIMIHSQYDKVIPLQLA
ncbi:MAG: acetylxylan esterase, partial [Nanoarchaeota archaeon]